MLPVTPAQQPFHGSRPDRCHPVGDRQLAQAQVLGGESRARQRSHAGRPRLGAGLKLALLHESSHRRQCGAADPASRHAPSRWWRCC
jgi:hypothetical protein